MLAQLRDDKNTSDAVYRTACASFGQKPPTPRSITIAPVTSLRQTCRKVCQPCVPSAEAWIAFEAAHGGLLHRRTAS